VVVLNDGKLAAFDTPKAVFAQRELIKSCGLDVPTAAKIADRLIANGVSVSPQVLTLEELAKELTEQSDPQINSQLSTLNSQTSEDTSDV